MSWEVKKLSEICKSIFAGGDVPKDRVSKFKTEKFNVPIYSNGEKNKGLYGFTDTARVLEPSITVSARGTIGYSEIRYEPFLPVVRLITLTPNTEKVELEFLKYIMKSIEFTNSGVAIPQLTVPMIKEYECTLPTVEEQKRIIEILDQAFAQIDQAKAHAEQNLKNAREVFENHLNRVFTNRKNSNKYKISDVAQIKGGKRVPKGYKLLNEKTDYPYLRVSDFTENGTICESDLRYIDKDIFDVIKNYTISTDDLYISIAGTIGRAGIIPDHLNGSNLTENACKLVFTDGLVNNKYLYYFTKTKSFINQAGINTRVAAQPKLALSRLGTIEFYAPNFDTQISLIKKFELLQTQVEKLESIYRQKIQALDELKQSLLQKAFSGQLTANLDEVA